MLRRAPTEVLLGSNLWWQRRQVRSVSAAAGGAGVCFFALAAAGFRFAAADGAAVAAGRFFFAMAGVAAWAVVPVRAPRPAAGVGP